jgi:serine/threonine protein kinase
MEGGQEGSSERHSYFVEQLKLRGPELSASQITLEEKIGDGSFGRVYKGKCFALDVAVKVPHRQTLNEQQLRTLRTELEIMSTISHPCIVLFLGACTVEGSFRIVTELLEGDLGDLIHNSRHPRLSLFEKMKIAKDAALGMNWLHSSKPQIIHRDLKLNNLLIWKQGNEHRVKICDFGLSSIKQSPQEMLRDPKGARGTPMYMAPEVMRNKEFDEKADVYSFGILLWEILTERKPFESHKNWDTFVEAVADDGERPLIPASCPPALRALMEDCWAGEPGLRPSFSEITDRLDSIIVEAALPDPAAAQFWKRYFIHNYQPGWVEFVTKFYEFLNVPLPIDETTTPLNKPAAADPRAQWIPPHKRFASVSEKKTSNPNQTPLNQNTLNQNQNQNQSQNQNVKSNLPSLEVATLRCLQALLVPDKSKDSKVSITRFNEVVAWFPPLRAGQGAFLQIIQNLLQMPWFHGLLSNTDLSRVLSGASEGTFLVRFSASNPGAYSISRIKGGAISNIRINVKQVEAEAAGEGKEGLEVEYWVSEDRTFGSIIELVNSVAPHLGLAEAARGSPFLPLFGLAEMPQGGGYDVCVTLN